MAEPDFDTVVIGAGVVGLATAAALSARGQSVLVLEELDRVGEATSARNSEIIHAGLYYRTGSLKHRLCVQGRRMLYDFLDRTGVPYRKCGKLIVAAEPREEAELDRLFALGAANGVEGLRCLSGREARALEPELSASAALLSAETGIFDSHDYLMRLVAILEDNGGLLALRTPFAAAETGDGGFTIRTGGADPATITAARLVNSAGLQAPGAAARIAGLPAAHVPRQWLARGCYFRLSGPAPFSRPIYPVPEDGGLGVHATPDMSGAMRFGPDVEWLPAGTAPSEIDYRVDPGRADAFRDAIRRYWPGLPEGRLAPDFSGVRPKLCGPGGGFFDFAIEGPETHGVPGLVNLFGIESPGLTASLAIAGAVEAALD